MDMLFCNSLFCSAGGGHIERFVSDSIAHAQEEAQREAQIAASAHLEGIHQKVLEVEAKIDGGLENISQHVQQLVEDSFAASQLQVDSCEGSTRAVQMEVETASPESVWRCTTRLASTKRFLEGRVQKALSNTQSELNLQVQRQADATTALREQIRKLNAQAKRQAQKSDGAALDTTVADLVRQEMEERFRGVQINAQRESDANIKFRQEAAVGEIRKTIRDE
ncbi:hypothetical protein L917_02575, partial [Phytophthora nicotianae]